MWYDFIFSIKINVPKNYFQMQAWRIFLWWGLPHSTTPNSFHSSNIPTHTYIHTHISIHTCTHIHVYTYTYTNTPHTHILHICTYPKYSHTSICIYTYTQIQTYNICIHICTNTLPYVSTFFLFPMLQWSVQMKARSYSFLKHCSLILCVGTCLLIPVLRKWIQQFCKFEAILGQRNLVSSVFF